MTLNISERSLFAIALFLLVCYLYAPRKRKVTPLPVPAPIPGTDGRHYNPPSTDMADEFIDVEAKETVYQ